MNNFKILALLALLFPSTVLAEEPDLETEPLPNLGVIEEMAYYTLSSGYITLSLPTQDGRAHFTKLDLGYMLVDENLLHLFQLNFALGGKSQIFSVGYGLGLGPRSGYFHGGVLINLGYAHLWDDTAEHVHALYMAVGPMLVFTLWPSWQFFLNVSWAGTPLISADVDRGRAFEGLQFTAGVGGSLD